MKLEQLGIRGKVINGLTRNVGNISSSSMPYALARVRGRLYGTIVCPTAAVGRPGSASLTQGCIVLKATRTPTRTAAPRTAGDLNCHCPTANAHGQPGRSVKPGPTPLHLLAYASG